MRKIADDGVASLYTGELARAICETAPHISPQDLAGYRVIRRRPVSTPFRGFEFTSNPPPSSGGVLIAYGLRLLDNWGRFDAPAVADAMREQAAARRDGSFLRSLYRGGLARRLMAPVDAPSNTTHISVVDERGNAVAMTCSTGAGSGVFVPGTGIHLNNMLGESDLAGHHKPGERLTSMMAPSICFERGRPRLVVGSAGSARLRGAIMQIVVNVLAHGLEVKDAVERPRIHWEDGVVHAEGGADVSGPWFSGTNTVAEAEPLLRRRERGGDSPRRRARGRGRSAARRRRRGRAVIIRRAEPADAAALVALANEVSAEPEGWLISTGWRGIAEERRFIRAVRRHPDAAVFVAELDSELVGRLSLARDAHPASGHVADLGLMVDGRHRRQGVGRALMEAAAQWARENG